MSNGLSPEPGQGLGLHGCLPILCTPFTADNAVDFASLRREIEFVLAEGASGVVALALASEGYKLTEREREQITDVVIETVAGRVPVVISADGTGPEPAIERAKRAAAAGADALMVLPPSFIKPGPAGLADYYHRISDAVTPPLIIQDAPQLTGVTMTPALWADLAAKCPSIRYVKVEGMPQGTTISETIRLSEGRLGVLCGWGGLSMLDALERGASGSMPAPSFTQLFASIQRRYEAGDIAGAEAEFAAGLPFVLWSMQSLDHSVATAKAFFVHHGIFTTPLMRQPSVPLDEIGQRQLQRFLDVDQRQSSRYPSHVSLCPGPDKSPVIPRLRSE